MNVLELNRIHGEYRQSVDAVRDPLASPEARETAQIIMVEKRHELDKALIEIQEEREDDARSAAVEERIALARLLGMPQPKPRIPVESIRAYADQRQQQVTFTVQPEKRTDITDAGSGARGDYIDPQSWYDRVINFEIASSGVLQAGPTMINTATGNQINIPILSTDASAGATPVAEGSAAAVTNPVWGQALLNAYRYDGFMAISDELLRDTNVDLESLLADYAGRALTARIGPVLGDPDVGTGSSVPAAISIGSTLGVTAASATLSPTLDELKGLYYSVLPVYRARARWIANSSVTLDTARAKDDSGNYLWSPSLSASEADTFMGKPWFEDAYFDTTATGNIPVVFGDVAAAYWVRNVGGIEVSFSRDFAFTSFETTMRFAQWIDAVTVDTLAVKHIVCP